MRGERCAARIAANRSAGSVSRCSPMAATRGTAASTGSAWRSSEHRYEHRVKGAAYAAEALGIEPALVAKTLVADVDGDFAFALVPGDRELSLTALARAAGGRAAALVEPARRPAADRLPVGGICPFGARTRAARVRRARLAGARARRAQRRRARR